MATAPSFNIAPGTSLEELQRRRALGEALMAKGMDASPVGHWTQGLARALQAGMGGYEIYKADQDNAAIKEDARKRIAMAALLGGNDTTTYTPPPVQTNTPQPNKSAAFAPPPASDGNPSIAESPAPQPMKWSDQDFDNVVRTIYGEADNQSPQGQAAVAAVIANRLRAGNFGQTPTDVVMAPNQFEPWSNPQAKQRMMQLAATDPAYQNIANIVRQVQNGEIPDPTNGATHFFAPKAQAALNRPEPKWAQGQTGLDIGDHRFFNLQNGPGSQPTTTQQNVPAAPPPMTPQRRLQLTQALLDNPYTAQIGQQLFAQQLQREQNAVRPLNEGERKMFPGAHAIKADGTPIYPPPAMNVSLSADKEGAELFAKRGIEAWDNANNAAREATKRQASYGTMLQALQGFQPGATAELRLKGKAILKDLGLIKGEEVADGEVLQAVARRLELAAVPKGQGQITENERTLIRETIPSIKSSPEAMVRMIQMLDRLDQYEIQVAKIYRDNMRKNNGKLNYLDVQDEIAALGPPMTEQEQNFLIGIRQPAVNAPPPGQQTPPGTPRDLPDNLKKYKLD